MEARRWCGARRDLVQLHTRPCLKLAQSLPGASLRARARNESSNARNRDLEFTSRITQLCVQAAVKQLVFKMKVVLALALGASALAPSQQPKVSHPRSARRVIQPCRHLQSSSVKPRRRGPRGTLRAEKALWHPRLLRARIEGLHACICGPGGWRASRPLPMRMTAPAQNQTLAAGRVVAGQPQRRAGRVEPKARRPPARGDAGRPETRESPPPHTPRAPPSKTHETTP